MQTNNRFILLIIVAIAFTQCQKEIWGNDIDCLLTNWKSKTWRETNSKNEKTYSWLNPRRFSTNNGNTGLWYLPQPGILRETTFTFYDTTVRDYKLIYINTNEFKVQSVDEPEKYYIYHVK